MDVSLLKTIPLFADVPDEKLGKIAPFATTDEFAEGEVVVKEGGYSNHFFAIEEGTAKVERDGETPGRARPGRRVRRAGTAGEAGALGDRDRDLAAEGDQDRALGALADAKVDARGGRGAPAQGRGPGGVATRRPAASGQAGRGIGGVFPTQPFSVRRIDWRPHRPVVKGSPVRSRRGPATVTGRARRRIDASRATGDAQASPGRRGVDPGSQETCPPASQINPRGKGGSDGHTWNPARRSCRRGLRRFVAVVEPRPG